MEKITFQREALNTGDIGRLSAHDRDVFYRRITQGVVVVKVEAPVSDGSEGSEGSDLVTEQTGSGFFYDDSGNILTCAHLFMGLKLDDALIEFRRFDDNCFKSAKVVDIDDKLDLAILQPLKPDDTSKFFFGLGNPHDARVGMECISIGHPDGLVYSMGIGHIAYPCMVYGTSTLGDSYCTNPPIRIYDHIKSVKEDTKYSSLQLIHSNNVHLWGGASGCPIINADGLVLGLHILGGFSFSFCIHVNVLKKFVEDYNTRAAAGSKKRKIQN